MTDDLFYGTSGPHDAKIVLVGEAWGEEEARRCQPFVGSSGWVLDKMLRDAGLSRSSILCTNVVNARPPNNDFNHFLVHKDDKAKAEDSVIFGIRAGRDLHQGVQKLQRLISTVGPRLVVAAGNWPLWALSSHSVVKTVKGYQHPSGIANWRGSQTYTRPSIGSNLPLLPIYHPAAVMREWKLRAITVHDLRARAGRFLTKHSWDPPHQQIIHKPTYKEVIRFLGKYLSASDNWVSVDIETYRHRWVSCIGLADSSGALCIPLFSFNQEGRCEAYWAPNEEATIWQLLKFVLENPHVKIIGQNFGYDTQFFYRWYGINAIVTFDTMVAHHLLYPGTPKGLDDLASLYCDHYCFWKKESQDWDTREFGAEAHWLYNAKDCLYTYEVAMVLMDLLKTEGMEELHTFQLAQWRLAREMTIRGVGYDRQYVAATRRELQREAATLAAWLDSAVPEEIRRTSTGIPWHSSPHAILDLFYKRLGLPENRHKKTGQPTVDDSALQAIEERQPWLLALTSRIRHLRSIKVFTSHFLDAEASADGRMHCTFNPAHVETFRWSSSATGFREGTNLQNIPKPVED